MRDLLLYLRDIRKACEKVQRYTAELDYNAFLANEIVYDAVLRNLTVIGEAVKSVPLELRERHPEIPWRRIAGFRDIAVHVYFGIDNETLWDIVRSEVPDLFAQIDEVLETNAPRTRSRKEP